MKNDIEFEPNAICPWCRRTQSGEWVRWNIGMMLDGEIDVVCASCDRAFFVEQHVTTTYSTRKIGAEKP